MARSFGAGQWARHEKNQEVCSQRGRIWGFGSGCLWVLKPEAARTSGKSGTKLTKVEEHSLPTCIIQGSCTLPCDQHENCCQVQLVAPLTVLSPSVNQSRQAGKMGVAQIGQP